jgi:hypothetical protein
MIPNAFRAEVADQTPELMRKIRNLIIFRKNPAPMRNVQLSSVLICVHLRLVRPLIEEQPAPISQPHRG